jgi:beta-alanine--pyruvate transaminase
MTGADAFGVTPDIMNFAKQVTNGTQPLGGVIATKEIYDTFMAAGGPDYMLEFPHGYTYSAHPVACAAGVAALDLLVKEDAVARVRDRAAFRGGRARAEGSAPYRRHPQLRARGRPDDRGAAGRAGTASVRDRDALLGEGFLRALRRRHDPARAAVHRREREIDNLVNALSDALNEVD